MILNILVIGIKNNKLIKLLRLHLITLSLLCFSLNSFGSYLVVDVVDGDTLWMLENGVKKKLRLSQIDAPERAQPFGDESADFLKELILNKEINVIFQSKKDRYGRYLGEIFLDNTNINKLLVRNGFAWVYVQYVTDETYYEDLKIAKKQKLNIWSSDEQISPWEWRRKD